MAEDGQDGGAAFARRLAAHCISGFVSIRKVVYMCGSLNRLNSCRCMYGWDDSWMDTVKEEAGIGWVQSLHGAWWAGCRCNRHLTPCRYPPCMNACTPRLPVLGLHELCMPLPLPLPSRAPSAAANAAMAAVPQ